jgi:hypothetical protein
MYTTRNKGQNITAGWGMVAGGDNRSGGKVILVERCKNVPYFSV